MKREWKPGDVAMVANEVAMYVDQDGDRFWITPIGTHWRVPNAPQRPLAVIDPGARGDTDLVDVDRLDDLLWALEYDHDKSYMERYAIVAKALREFANPTPPRPEEPTGLGAVVEDQHGDNWVRMEPRIADFNWIHASDPARSRAWRNLSAVRVLSEGVSA